MIVVLIHDVVSPELLIILFFQRRSFKVNLGKKFYHDFLAYSRVSACGGETHLVPYNPFQRLRNWYSWISGTGIMERDEFSRSGRSAESLPRQCSQCTCFWIDGYLLFTWGPYRKPHRFKLDTV